MRTCRSIPLQEFQDENLNANGPHQTNSGSKVSAVDMIFHFLAPPRELHPQKVAGRLQFFAQNWQIITQDPWVLQTIQGYEIELLSHPSVSGHPTFEEQQHIPPGSQQLRHVPLDPHALEDLRWWVDNLHLPNGHPIPNSFPNLMI